MLCAIEHEESKFKFYTFNGKFSSMIKYKNCIEHFNPLDDHFQAHGRTERNNMLSSDIQVPGTLAHTSNLDTGTLG